MTMSTIAERRGPPRHRAPCVISLIVCSIFTLVASAHADIPPRPAERQFLHDLAAIISDTDQQKIRTLQQEVFDQAKVPIVVVTINRMQYYVPGITGIESFARRWFDSWGIGSQQKNDGILLIVSTGDRTGRIELGAAWGDRFDVYCQRIMDKYMIPHFKNGSYGAGLVAGVEQLAEMAKAGPQAQPPGPGLGERFRDATAVVRDVTGAANEHNPIAEKGGWPILTLLTVAGLGCFVAARLLPSHRKTLVIVGAVLIALVFAFWLVVVGAFIFISSFLPSRRRGSRYGGSWGGSYGGGGGGGFGGGSSGGGGASGSW